MNQGKKADAGCDVAASHGEATIDAPLISAVLTVYNKSTRLPATIASLRRQMADERRVEYVFVDDGSCDDSAAVITDAMAGAPLWRMIGGKDNFGPSVRLNQGIRAAQGEWIFALDADDIVLEGAIASMLDLLITEDADLIYGRTCRTAGFTDLPKVDRSARHEVSDAPLARVLQGGLIRMGMLGRKELFLAANGADERVFVQDESLALRLAAQSRRLIAWNAAVVLIPGRPGDGTSHVSENKTQLHHDAFLARRLALEDLAAQHPSAAPKLYAGAVSAYWKHLRQGKRLSWLHPGFWRYLEAKCLQPAPKDKVLRWMEEDLLALPGVRRSSMIERRRSK